MQDPSSAYGCVSFGCILSRRTLDPSALTRPRRRAIGALQRVRHAPCQRTQLRGRSRARALCSPAWRCHRSTTLQQDQKRGRQQVARPGADAVAERRDTRSGSLTGARLAYIEFHCQPSLGKGLRRTFPTESAGPSITLSRHWTCVGEALWKRAGRVSQGRRSGFALACLGHAGTPAARQPGLAALPGNTSVSWVTHCPGPCRRTHFRLASVRFARH